MANPEPPQTPRPTRTSRQLFRHPWRIAIVAAILVTVLNLAVVLVSASDTSDTARSFPGTVAAVLPEPGSLSRLQDTVAADLRDDLTGVLVIDGVEVPEDQLERVVALGQVSFRPGPDQDLTRFEPGVHTVTVVYWKQGKMRPTRPDSYTWSFRAGA